MSLKCSNRLNRMMWVFFLLHVWYCNELRCRLVCMCVCVCVCKPWTCGLNSRRRSSFQGLYVAKCFCELICLLSNYEYVRLFVKFFIIFIDGIHREKNWNFPYSIFKFCRWQNNFKKSIRSFQWFSNFDSRTSTFQFQLLIRLHNLCAWF